MTRRHRRRRSTEGFTLFELAIVVLIMGGMAMAVAPGLADQMADARAEGAAEDLVRLYRVIRSRANHNGLAQLMVFTAANDEAGRFGLGAVRVWEGMNNRCSSTPWSWTINGDPDDGHLPVDWVDMGAPAYNQLHQGGAPTSDDAGRHVIRIRSGTNGAGTAAALCFEPGGATLVGVADATDAANVGYTFTRQTDTLVFVVTRTIKTDGTEQVRGVPREVVFPTGGHGRLRF